MELMDAIMKRRSIRRFKSTPVEKAKIEKVMEAGRRAPSWGNTQPWRFVVVQDKARREEIVKAAGGQPHASQAGALIVCCYVAEALSKKQHGDALKQLRDLGVMDWTDEFLDKVILGSDVFAPYLLGESAMKIRAGEQLMIAVAFMTLEAVEQGLATCWLGAITPKEVQKVMNLPAGVYVHSILPLGYADEDPKPRPRKDMKEIVFWEKYG